MNEPRSEFDGDSALDSLMQPDQLREAIAQQPERALWRFGRKLQALADERAELGRYRRMILEECDQRDARLVGQMAVLNGAIEAYALAQRERDPNRKQLVIPGVGTWQTKTQPASWRTVDEAAVVASLEETPDELMQLTEPREGRDLLKDEFKRWLVGNDFEAFPGMERTPERIVVTGPFK